MGRIHLFEFEDLTWFPKQIRNYMTDFLQFVTNQFDFYKGIPVLLEKGVNLSKNRSIVDLASGGGGGWKTLGPRVQKQLPGVKVQLTDYYPNLRAFEQLKENQPGVFEVVEVSIDARSVPENLKGFRTQFLSLHHFRPNDVVQILSNAVTAEEPILCVEGQKRSFGDFIKFFFSPINVILVTPFIKPLTFGRLFFTYLIPIVPLFVWWDGLVSVLRTYSSKELDELIQKADPKNEFDWEVDKLKSGKVWIYYLMGVPKR